MVEGDESSRRFWPANRSLLTALNTTCQFCMFIVKNVQLDSQRNCSVIDHRYRDVGMCHCKG